MNTINTIDIKIDNCLDCKHHSIIPDPDPDDWFCDDDVAVVCQINQNPDKNPNSKYLSDRHEHRSITCSCRPYRIRKESNIPDWCQLR